jgi:hypothetical protein
MSMPRRLPSPEESLRILASKPTKPPRRPPRAAGRALAPYIKALDERFGQGPGALRARWREIVGETLASRTEPAKLIKGRQGQPGALEIRVQGPAASLIQHQAQDILARVNLFLGDGAVGRLRIVQGAVKPLPARKQARPSRKIGPLDAGREEALAKSLSDAGDGALKDALTRLGRAVLKQEREPG